MKTYHLPLQFVNLEKYQFLEVGSPVCNVITMLKKKSDFSKIKPQMLTLNSETWVLIVLHPLFLDFSFSISYGIIKIKAKGKLCFDVTRIPFENHFLKKSIFFLTNHCILLFLVYICSYVSSVFFLFFFLYKLKNQFRINLVYLSQKI